MPGEIRIIIVHPQEIVREGLRAILNRRPDFRLVGEACSMENAVEAVRRARPDVVILGIRAADAAAIDACRAIHDLLPAPRIIMLMAAPEDELVTASILAGACAVFLQGIDGDALLSAIESVAAGASLLDPVVTEHVLDLLRGGGRYPADPIAPLSSQERRVLDQIAAGKTNREIASALVLSEKTVKNYVSSILNKLKMHRRSEAAAFVARRTAGER